MSESKYAKFVKVSKAKPRPSKGGKKARGSAVDRLRATTIGDVGEILSEGAGYLKRMLNVEVKRHDYAPVAFVPGTAGAFGQLSMVGLGDDYNNRDGHSIRAVSLELRTSFTLTASSPDYMRFILFVDTECQGTTPAVVDLLESASPFAPFQHDNLLRFQILEDQLVPMVPNGPGHAVSIVHKMRLSHHLKFQAAPAAIGSCREGAIFALWIGTLANTSATVSSRLSFVDN